MLGEGILPNERNAYRSHNSCLKTVRKQDTKSVIGSASKMINLPGVFVVPMATCGLTCGLGAFFSK
jgi:hypothetical protein